MSDDTTPDGSRTRSRARKSAMAPEHIWHYLQIADGEASVAEISAAKDYGKHHIRRTATDYIGVWGIQGEKDTPIFRFRINGQWVVLTGSRHDILQVLEKVAPDLKERAAKTTTRDELFEVISQYAADKYIVDRQWKFWLDPTDPANAASMQQASSGSQAEADD